ncbi:MAG: phage portal protein [Methanocorpusculum sp.]|nr:phage portal protein [Methanocorpusculum sp.]
MHKVIPYKDIAQAKSIASPLSTDMITALDTWYLLYSNKAAWLKPGTVKSLNLPAFISSEMARQVVLEMKWNISGVGSDGKTQDANGDDITNPRAEYLKKEFAKLMDQLRPKLEQGLAAGGMAIRPYPKDGHIYFDWTMDWSLYPIAFGDSGELTAVIFRDCYTEGDTIYTRLERHRVEGNNVVITQEAFKSNNRNTIGTPVALSEVEQWSSLQPEATVTDADGQMFGWFKTAAANNVDIDCPMGASVYSKAVEQIREADLQWSRFLWEFEGSELAVDVDPQALKPRKDGNGVTTPQLNERLFRGVDLGTDETYKVFSPQIRYAAQIAGINQIFKTIEDLVGFARGTISDANVDVKTATELKINKQRSYATVSDNQQALERCLTDVIRVMDKFATIYGLAPEGEYEVSFDWDDSIITDASAQLTERLMLINAGLMSKVEFRQWYFNETPAQAQAALDALRE